MLVEFIPASWLERAAWTPGLVVYSRPVFIERRGYVRRADDRMEQLLKSILLA
jgi:hypothetical protein